MIAYGGPDEHAVANDGRKSFSVGAQHRAVGHCVVRDEGVEYGPPDDVAVVGERRVLGPPQLERSVMRDCPQPVDAVVLPELRLETHIVELLHRPWGEAITAGFFTRERVAFDEHHIEPVLGGPVRRTRSGWPPADDEEVVHQPAAGAMSLMIFWICTSEAAPSNLAGSVALSATFFSCSRSFSGWPPKRTRS